MFFFSLLPPVVFKTETVTQKYIKMKNETPHSNDQEPQIHVHLFLMLSKKERNKPPPHDTEQRKKQDRHT